MKGAAALLALVACGAPIRAAAPTAREARSAPPAPAPAAAPPPPELPNVGALERPGTLARFFQALARLEAGEATDDVRVAQFGDSHTAADWQTGPMRRQLQARFGDGGRGFVPLGLPWKAWSQEGVLTGMAGWSTQMSALAGRPASRDGIFGFGGVALASRQGGARAWIDVLAATSRAELWYLEQPGGGSFELVVDGKNTGRITTRAEERRAGVRAIELAEASRHHVEVHAIGDGEARVFGLALDRAAHGVVFDALGINGARVATALSWSEMHWAEQLRRRAPKLVILAYGTNDAVDVDTTLEAFETDIADAVARVRRALPDAACLVLGPPDRASSSGATWLTPPRLLEIVARERRVAETDGCAFYDQVAAMGGAGSMAKWAVEAYPRGQPDRVHLSRTGYAELATSFVTDLLGAYDLWRANRR